MTGIWSEMRRMFIQATERVVATGRLLRLLSVHGAELLDAMPV